MLQLLLAQIVEKRVNGRGNGRSIWDCCLQLDLPGVSSFYCDAVVEPEVLSWYSPYLLQSLFLCFSSGLLTDLFVFPDFCSCTCTRSYDP